MALTRNGIDIPLGEGPGLNLGGGAGWSMPGWHNVEHALGYDLNDGLPAWPNETVDRIYCSHALEHLRPEAARRLLSACRRALRPGGVLRLVLPDCEKFATAWRNGDEAFFSGNPCLTPHFTSLTDCLIQMGGNPLTFDEPSALGHWFFWDRHSLTWLLAVAGFRKVLDSSYGMSHDPVMEPIATLDAGGMPLTGFDNPLTRPISVYIEAVA